MNLRMPSPWKQRFKDGLLLQALRFFRLSGSRERAARGFAIGLACNFYPTFGIGGFISGFLARLFGGNMIAGFVGGSLLAFFWPVLFYLNIRVGGIFVRPPMIVEDLEDVTPQAVSALVWGQTFAVGCLINSLVAGAAAYFLFLAAYERFRPTALVWLRERVRLRRRTDALNSRRPRAGCGESPR